MSLEIRESDWQAFRRLYPIALERFCQRVLAEVELLASNAQISAHERYREIYSLMRERDKELASLFNDFRRSTAMIQLMYFRSRGLLTPEELALFSEEARQTSETAL